MNEAIALGTPPQAEDPHPPAPLDSGGEREPLLWGLVTASTLAFEEHFFARYGPLLAAELRSGDCQRQCGAARVLGDVLLALWDDSDDVLRRYVSAALWRRREVYE